MKTFSEVLEATQLAASIAARMMDYEKYLFEQYGDGEPTRKLVADAKFEIGEFCDWLRGRLG